MMRGKEVDHTEGLRSQQTSYKLRPHLICSRCGGLMVTEFSIDLPNGTSELENNARRCIQCGDIIDSVILRNRSLSHQSLTAEHPHVSMALRALP